MPKEPTKHEDVPRISSTLQTSASPNAMMLRCQMCGQYATTRLVSIRQNIGAAYMRFTKIIEGELCRKCIRKYSLQYTAVNLVAGWWGIISFFVTPVYIVNNIYEYCRTFAMKD
jgi:ribosomal protein S14